MSSHLALQFRNEGGITRLRVLQQQVPWRAIRAFENAEGEALVHLHNVSGGILAGDDLRLLVDVGPGAKAQITATGATRLYRSGYPRRTAFHEMNARVQEGGYLEYLPDAVIPYAGSSYQQSVAIELESNAGLLCWDTLACGRLASGEAFAFEDFTSRFEIRAPDGPAAIEQFRLCPGDQKLASPARFGDFGYSATLYACRVSENISNWLPLERQLNAVADELSTGDIRWGASSLTRHGVVVRCLSREAHLMTAGLRRFWADAKLAIFGRAACVPRKIH